MKSLIREYNLDDIDGLKKCVWGLKEFESQFDNDYLVSEESVKDLLVEIQKGNIFVAEVNKKIAGFISVNIENKNDELIVGKIDTLYISDFSVLSECRGKGIGHKLIEEVERLAKQKNIKYMKLRVFSKNRAIELYKEMGFVEYETTMLKAI